MIARAAIRDYTGIMRTPNDHEIWREAKTYVLRQEFGREWMWNERVHRGCR